MAKLLPNFLRQRAMQFTRTMAATVLELARVFVSPLVVLPFGHEVPLVEQDIRSFDFVEIIVDPRLILGDKFVHVVVSSFSEVDVKHASHESSVNDPDTHGRFEFLPEPDVYFLRVGEAAAARHFLNVPQFLPFGPLCTVGCSQGGSPYELRRPCSTRWILLSTGESGAWALVERAKTNTRGMKSSFIINSLPYRRDGI